MLKFSRHSRSRLLERFARLDTSETRPIFLTLTYPDQYPAPLQAKVHLDNFLKRLKRRFPAAPVSGIWRMEFQERGAPHFHILLFHLPYWHKREVQIAWSDVIGAEDNTFTRIEAMKSYRQTMYYVSKYCAKIQGDVSGGFIYRPYLTDCLIIHNVTGEIINTIGRFWGVFNRDNLPFAARTEIDILEFRPDMGCRLLDLLSRQWAGVWNVSNTGGAIFLAHSSLVVGVAAWMLVENPERAPPINFLFTPRRELERRLDKGMKA